MRKVILGSVPSLVVERLVGQGPEIEADVRWIGGRPVSRPSSHLDSITSSASLSTPYLLKTQGRYCCTRPLQVKTEFA
jgi:hypothetical protein